MNTPRIWPELGICVPRICLPSSEVDPYFWAVVACDQYSSHPEYWEKTALEIGEHPSTLRCIYPECYLSRPDKPARIEGIRQSMENYLQKGLIQELEDGMIYVERKITTGKTRKGLVLALDLESYDFDPTMKAMIRATEGTILDRIPPRVQIREKAPLEFPHIIVLIDDPQNSVIDAAAQAQGKTVYDFPVNNAAGHLKGSYIGDQESLEKIRSAFAGLKNEAASRYKEDFLFAVGDGNHSLATAKAIWSKIKDDSPSWHPARYALVEIVNIYDESLDFEPIHRVVFNANAMDLLQYLKTSLGVELEYCETREKMLEATKTFSASKGIGFCFDHKYGLLTFKSPDAVAAIGKIQQGLDAYTAQNAHSEIDYIHGDEQTVKLSATQGRIGFLLPPIEKNGFFPAVWEMGILPRKTFSLGHADDKRYYMEGRKITAQ